MAHFAKIDSNNKVLEILVVPDDQQHRGQDFLAIDLQLGGTWIQTSYNTRGNKHILGGVPFRKNYAYIDGTYDPIRDAFIPPKPFASWILDEKTCLWDSPIPYPNDKKKYVWNECIVNWTPYPENPNKIPVGWNISTCEWVFMPQDGNKYKWNIISGSWDIV